MIVEDVTMNKRKAHFHLSSAQIIIVGFLSVILLGGLLAALLCGKVGKRSNKRLVKSHKKLRSV